MASWRTCDTLVILAAAFIRSAAIGLVGVIIGIHFARLGLSPATTGVIIGAGLAGGAIATLIIALRGDRLGRRRMLIVLTLAGAAGFGGLALTTSLLVLLPLAFVCMLNGFGRDRGAASALEQALLPATTTDARRTWVLAWYNVVTDVGNGTGALAAATPTFLAAMFGTDIIVAERATFVLCGVTMAVSAAFYVCVSPRVETEAGSGAERRAPMPASTRQAVRRLSMLFAVDGLGGGFLSSALIAYWFFVRFGLSEAQLATLFFVARMLNTTGHLSAAWLARRIGLVNTMVFTHLPSSLFIIAAPFAPNATIAAVLFLCREALVEMDVPTRQSYVMAIVPPADRTAASALTNLTRTAGWALGPAFAGMVMQQVLAGPLVIGGMLKIVYDVLLYASFRRVTPPEERA